MTNQEPGKPEWDDGLLVKPHHIPAIGGIGLFCSLLIGWFLWTYVDKILATVVVIGLWATVWGVVLSIDQFHTELKRKSEPPRQDRWR